MIIRSLASEAAEADRYSECDRKYCDRSGGHLCSPGYAASAVGTECGEDCTVIAGDDREYQSYGGSSV